MVPTHLLCRTLYPALTCLLKQHEALPAILGCVPLIPGGPQTADTLESFEGGHEKFAASHGERVDLVGLGGFQAPHWIVFCSYHHHHPHLPTVRSFPKSSTQMEYFVQDRAGCHSSECGRNAHHMAKSIDMKGFLQCERLSRAKGDKSQIGASCIRV